MPDAFKFYLQEGRARNMTFGVKKLKNESDESRTDNPMAAKLGQFFN